MRERNRFPCPCCGFLTLEEEPPGTFDICPVCNWEDDFVQFEDPEYEGGANRISLVDARRNFAAYGAICEESRDRVSKPLSDEIPS
jgi:hypothetical protein